MNTLKTNINNIKSIAKILKKELATMNFEISHSSALNLASKSLGFKNYQTYNGIDDNFLEEFSLTIKDFKDLEVEKLEKYPSIYNKFVKIGQTQEYDIYIDREVAGEKYNYFLIFEVKNNYTGRVFFLPEYNTFSLFVYPNLQNPTNDYHIQLNTDSKVTEYIDILQHLNDKRWMTKELFSDLLKLIEKVQRDKKELLKILHKYSKKELETIYKSHK
jgi:hypothetical protein